MSDEAEVEVVTLGNEDEDWMGFVDNMEELLGNVGLTKTYAILKLLTFYLEEEYNINTSCEIINPDLNTKTLH